MAIIATETWTGTNGDPWNASTWAEASASGTGAVTIQTNTGQMVVDSGGYGRSRLTMSDLADFEALVSFAQTSVTGWSAFQMHVRTDTAWSGGDPTNGYIIYAVGGADASSQSLVLDKIVAGTPTNIVFGAYTASGTAATWLRVRLVGTSIKARAWKDGTAEPGTWNIDQTDADLSTGKIGLSAFATAAITVNWDTLTVDDLVTGSPHVVLGRHTPGTVQHRNVRS
jgi:hypothetical protein